MMKLYGGAVAVQRIHLIFKTHLDVGFTDFAHRVVSNYFEHYIPGAIRLARELRQAGGPERFVWTTGSWLIYEYLEQASIARRALMEEAIAAGDIVWHGLPFTTHSELMDAGLFRFGLSLSQELDRRFGRRTIAAKMTDVPGHTRGIVPLMAEAGLQFLHIGINGASTPPQVPPVFVWRDPSGAEIVVMIHKDYGSLMVVPGLDEAIAFAHTGDNLGPQSPEQIRQIFADTQALFPGAEIVASTMDAFAAKLGMIKNQLPVVTQEIGDTWIHGVGTDPKKVAQLRELLRLRNRWLAQEKIDPQDARFKAFSRFLLLVPEHTWGLDLKTHLADFDTYEAAAFQSALPTPRFQKFTSSWDEQRQYILSAVAALGDLPQAAEARGALQALEPVRPVATQDYESVDPCGVFGTPHFRFAFDHSGALMSLADKHSHWHWASAAHLLGQLRFETFSQADYDRFYRQYVRNKRQTASWSRPDFTKPGMELAGALHRFWYPTVSFLYRRREAQGWRYLLELAFPGEAVEKYGCPREATVELAFPDQELAVYSTLQWFNKPASRLPEALWFSINPHVNHPDSWHLDKLGEPVSPLDVVFDGNRHLHAVGRGADYQDPERQVVIESLDAPLVAPGQPSLLEFTNLQPPLKRGLHFLLYNNVWGTNFPMWYGEDARFRFALHLK